MSDEQVESAALADSEAQPMTSEELVRMRRAPNVKAIRARLGMTQEQLAKTSRLPLGTVRD